MTRLTYVLLIGSFFASGRPAFAQADLVARVKDALVLQGQTFTTNCDAFEILYRVAWLKKDQGAQLVGKRPEQNGCDFGGRKYSHDVIAFPTGWRDILESAGPPANVNRPIWNVTGTSPDAPLYAPFDPGGTLDPPPTLPPAPPPVVVPGPITSLQEQILAEFRLHEAAEAIDRAEAKAFRDEAKGIWDSVGQPLLKYVVPSVVTGLTVWLQTRQPPP